jgi:hypothetical protein
MEGELDPFDFDLAERLHLTVAQLPHAVSRREYFQWRAYTVYRNAQQELALKEAVKSGRR